MVKTGASELLRSRRESTIWDDIKAEKKHPDFMQKNQISFKSVKYLNELYKTRKKAIIRRLNEFKHQWNKSDREIFSELCFCLLTPQSNAESCDRIIQKLKKTNLLYKGTCSQIQPHVKNARFYKHKSQYIIEARKMFSANGGIVIKNKLDTKNILKTRDWLVENVKGIGYKEASHFLRNIGFGDNLAILDIHILRGLKNYGALKSIPKSLTKKEYLRIEEKLRGFAKKIKIPLSHLDLLLWSAETNKIFK